MITIQPLLSKEKKANKADEIKLDVHLTGMRITMVASPKSQGLSEQIEKRSNYLTFPVFTPTGMGPAMLREPDHGVMQGFMATAQLPVVRIGFSVAINGKQIEAALRDLRALIQPISPATALVDPITSPVAVFASYAGQNRQLIGAGVLIDVQQNFLQQGRGLDLLLQGEMSILDCRLDTEFLKAIQLEHLQ